MATYRHGRWVQWDGVEFCSIEKKTFFGWKELSWWYDTPAGILKMEEAVKHLRELGHIVL